METTEQTPAFEAEAKAAYEKYRITEDQKPMLPNGPSVAWEDLPEVAKSDWRTFARLVSENQAEYQAEQQETAPADK